MHDLTYNYQQSNRKTKQYPLINQSKGNNLILNLKTLMIMILSLLIQYIVMMNMLWW